jgi:hypothetical protein
VAPGGAVTSLLAAAAAQQHLPLPLAVLRLAGGAPTAGGGTLPRGAWQQLLRVLHCLRQLRGAARWEALMEVSRHTRPVRPLSGGH